MTKEPLLKPLLFMAIVLFHSPLVRGEDLGSLVLARIEQKALAVRSYQAFFDLWMRVGEDEFFLTGTTLFKWPGMLRVEMALEDRKGLRQVLYRRGGVVWQYLPSIRVAFHQKEEELEQKFPEFFASQELVNIQNPFALLESRSVTFLDEERAGEETIYLFEGIPKQSIRHQGLLKPALCRMRIADQDGLLREMVLYDAAGREIVKQTFQNIQPNIELSDKEFVFQPEDVKLVEVTKQTEKKMRLLLEGKGDLP